MLKRYSGLFKDNLPVTAFFLFIGLQSAFQFPLINGFPFFMMACFTGYAFSLLHPEGIKINPSGWIFISFLNAAMVIGGIVSYFLSFSSPYSASLNNIAYQLNRDNWQAAIASAQSALKDGNPADANIILDQELQRHPHNYIALTVKANMAHAISSYDKECSLLKQIDAYFLNQSSYHEYIITQCKNY